MTPIEIEIDKDLEDLAPGYLESRKKEIIKLRELYSQNAIAELTAIAHKLAGNAGGYGFQELTHIGKRLETAGKENNKAEIEKELNNINQYLNEVVIKFV